MYNDYMWNLYGGGGSGIVQGIIPYGPGWGPGYCTTNIIQSINQYNQTGLENIKSSRIKEINSNESISNYMDKEFLYESELKDIEDKFYFKFEYLNKNCCDSVTKVCKELVSKIKERKENFEFISFLFVSDYFNKVNIQTNDSLMSVDIYLSESQMNVLRNIRSDEETSNIHDSTIKTNEKIKNICNSIIKQENQGYQKFYEKYKNRIVKDNEYEDLSFYEKILKENT